MATSSQASEDPNIGRVVAGKYRIDAIVGTGASGTVYRASHAVLERAIALKVLSPRFLANENARARFRREARAASKLDHPNSVQVLDYGIEPDGLTYMAMELLEGRELLQVIYDDWPLGTERIVRIMGQVLSVLAAAHDAGIVHRDLKPENIMLVKRPGDDGRESEMVKVADFGIAKTIAGPVSEESLNLTRDGAVHGTPEYMSPEQARGDAVDGRTDIWACGVILYEMMTGTLPFEGDGPFDVIMKLFSDPVVPPYSRRRDIDRRLEPVVMHALAKPPAERYPDARAMRDALLEAAARPQLVVVEERPLAPAELRAPVDTRRKVTTVARSVPPPPAPPSLQLAHEGRAAAETRAASANAAGSVVAEGQAATGDARSLGVAPLNAGANSRASTADATARLPAAGLDEPLDPKLFRRSSRTVLLLALLAGALALGTIVFGIRWLLRAGGGASVPAGALAPSADAGSDAARGAAGSPDASPPAVAPDARSSVGAPPGPPARPSAARPNRARPAARSTTNPGARSVP